MSVKINREFELVVKDILDHNEFQELRHELHHGISRYSHSVRVAKKVYQFSKWFHWDCENTTRAALLHDFYFDKQLKDCSIAKTWCTHPNVALQNAKERFDLDERQENVIASHMFPTCKVVPKYKESILVGMIDKGVSIYEQYRFKLGLVLGVWVIFLFNMITMQK